MVDIGLMQHLSGMPVDVEYARTDLLAIHQGAMAEQFVWIAEHPDAARAEALRGREHVERTWRRETAFADLRDALAEVAGVGG